MSIPLLTKHGLLPVGVHDAHFSEIEARFAPKENMHRCQLWTGLSRFLNMLSGNGGMECVDAIYIDGSFISDKQKPSDIDIVFEVDPDADVASCAELFRLASDQEAVKSAYGVHPFSQLRGDSSRNLVAYFQRLKERDAMNRDVKLLPKCAQKGIIRTVYD